MECDELEVEGCTDPSACNYDSSATDDDGSCLQNDLCGVCGGDNSSCSGCTDSSACNYDSSATLDDGSCTYPEMYYDCNGNCVNDTDGDGICDELKFQVVLMQMQITTTLTLLMMMVAVST